MVFSTLEEIKREVGHHPNASVVKVYSLIKFVEDIMRIIIDTLNSLKVCLTYYINIFS